MKMILGYRVWAPLLAAALCPLPAHAQVPAGGEFVVTTNGSAPAVTADARGNFVVAFVTHPSGDTDRSNIALHRYDASGASSGPEFQVNTYTTGCQGDAYQLAVASASDGDFVVVWTSFPCFDAPSQDGSLGGIYAQRYDAAGLPRGTEFRVNTYTTGDQSTPALTSDASGNTVVVWTGDQNGPGRGVFGQRYDAAGQPVGGEFQVEEQTGLRLWPSVATSASGSFVVTWNLHALDGQPLGLFARRFAPSGAPLGGEFRVDQTGGASSWASVAMNAEGGFVVGWITAQSFQLRARRYDADGAALGTELLVDAPYARPPVSLSIDASGSFVAAWTRSENLGDPLRNDVWARRYDASGAPRSDAFRVSPEYYRQRPAIVADASGNLVVASEFLGSDVVAQRFGGVVPAPALMDTVAGEDSDGNGVLEDGESVEVHASWRNVNGQAQTFDGRALAFTGPAAAGVNYVLRDETGTYGTVPNGSTAACSDCYAIGVASNGSRPAAHWDAQLTERLTPDVLGQTRIWPVHVGESFADVPKASPYYRFVETMLHRGVTAGCAAGEYCPRDAVTREQMAVFALIGKLGAAYLPLPCGPPVFADVPAASPYCRFIEDLARRGVVSGCGGDDYCPHQPLTRQEMAVFLLRTLDAALQPPACSAPNMFSDVSEDSPFCRWIEELARRGIASGCGDGRFCPGGPTTREQMAVLTSQTFGLSLY
jgi:hypothetical protein